MDVGSKIGQKMRLAIKVKLREMGCYVDDELPDYVMVMVANKRTRAQMEEDLLLFLGDNTEGFVNWLHQVLKKLQEVTVATPAVAIAEPIVDSEKPKTSSLSSKDKIKVKEKKDKTKTKKDKHKKSDSKKSKKKDKDHKKRDEKKLHKSKRKNKNILRPNIPPLLMNIEKQSEPSITDVFAGQILKNHGILLEEPDKENPKKKVDEDKKVPFPIIDIAAIINEDNNSQHTNSNQADTEGENTANSSSPASREIQLKEINEIEAKIQGLRQKLADKIDSMSDDEDFLNIRTEAEELMTDFADDVLQPLAQQEERVLDFHRWRFLEKSGCQELSLNGDGIIVWKPYMVNQPKPIDFDALGSLSLNRVTLHGVYTEISKETATPSPVQESQRTPSPKPFSPPQTHKPVSPTPEPELPQIELILPKRPKRSLANSEESNEASDKRPKSSERLTPDGSPKEKRRSSVRSRLGPPSGPQKRKSSPETTQQYDPVSKRLNSRISVLENENRRGPASVVRVKPRPRASSSATSNLLFRAVADAHKSLLNLPPKLNPSPPKLKQAKVLPMPRCNPQKFLIEVPSNSIQQSSQTADSSDCEIDIEVSDLESEPEKEKNSVDYIPTSITRKFTNTDYIKKESVRIDDSRLDQPNFDPALIHVKKRCEEEMPKDSHPQFVVTLDGLNPNVFLAKKLKSEGLLGEGEVLHLKNKDKVASKTKNVNKSIEEISILSSNNTIAEEEVEKSPEIIENVEKSADKMVDFVRIDEKKRLSETSDDSCTLVILKGDDLPTQSPTISEISEPNEVEITENVEIKPPEVRKRKASPIVFDVDRKVEKKERERNNSASSDGHVVVTTAVTHKYDAVPSLPQEKKSVPCRAFPTCRFGSTCAFQHPPCRYTTSCSRRNCVYSHPPAVKPPATVASHVVAAPNYKSITPQVIANICKYYPNCANPACHFFHPKPCRYGKSCINKLECNFYHHEVVSNAIHKWRSSKV